LKIITELYQRCDESKKPFVFTARRFWILQELKPACIVAPSLNRAGGHIYGSMPDADLLKQ